MGRAPKWHVIDHAIQNLEIFKLHASSSKIENQSHSQRSVNSGRSTPSIMSKRKRRRNGTASFNSLAAESNTAAATASQTPAIENNGSGQPKSLLAVYQGKPLRVTLRSLAPNPPDTSDGSDDLSPSTETEEDTASASDASEVQPARRTRSSTQRASAMRGEKPRGFSHQRLAEIDFTSSFSIEKQKQR
jgi:hypothetical protein